MGPPLSTRSHGSRFRELRVRTAISTYGQLHLLPNEVLLRSIDGVMNINGDAGTIGTMTWTSHRIVWVSQANELYNISVPYLVAVSSSLLSMFCSYR
jgi:hypothetical protein